MKLTWVEKELKEKDERTFNYFKKMEDNLGYLYSDSSFKQKYLDKEIVKNIDYDVINLSPYREFDYRLIKLKDDLFVVKYQYVCEDDFGFEYDYFSKEINSNEYSTFRFIQNLKLFFVHDCDDVYHYCIECEKLKKLHWLDNEGSVKEKFQCYQHNVCSNCLNNKEIRKEYGL